MKLILLLAIAGLSTAATLDNTYLPPSHAPSSGGSNILQAPGSSSYQPSAYSAPQGGYPESNNGYNPAQINFAADSNDNGGPYGSQMPQERAQAAFERNAKILRLDNQNDGMNYAYAYETENGISADEQGVADWAHGVEAQGGFSYTGDDGRVYSIRYTAGLNGFVPQGDHIPTPPPIPEEIRRALEKNAMDEAAGIYDDGSYNEGKYDSGEHGYPPSGNAGYDYHQGQNQNQYRPNQPIIESLGDADTVVTNNALIRDQQQPSFGNQGGQNQGHFGPNQAHSGVTQAYLPPVQRQSNQPSLGNQGFNQQPFGRQNQPTFGNQGPSFGSQQQPAFNSQAPGNQGPRSQAYLPPFDSQRSPSNQRPSNYRAPGFSNQFPRTQGGGGATNNAYLPPN